MPLLLAPLRYVLCHFSLFPLKSGVLLKITTSMRIKAGIALLPRARKDSYEKSLAHLSYVYFMFIYLLSSALQGASVSPLLAYL